MINGLQIQIHLPFFNITLPGNANLFNNKLLEIANFDIIDPSIITSLFLYFPDQDSFSFQL